jgi:MFS family permease
LWWVQEKHVSAALVAALLAAADLAVLALEMPTGWLADRFGHQRSLIAGSTVQAAGMVACWLCPGLASLLAGSLLIAVGDALRSGADQALLYRSCQADGVEPEFQRIEARTRAIGLAGLVSLVLTGGAIVHRWGFDAVWALDALLCISGVAVAIGMREPPLLAEADHGNTPAPLLSSTLILAILPAALLGAAASAASFVAQARADVPVDVVTWTVAAITLAEAAGSAAATRASLFSVAGQWLAAVLAVIAVSAGAGVVAGIVVGGGVVGDSAGTVVAAPLLAAVLSFAAGAAGPCRAAAIQRLAPDRLRASTASLASACDMACSTLLVPFVAVLHRR